MYPDQPCHPDNNQPPHIAIHLLSCLFIPD